MVLAILLGSAGTGGGCMAMECAPCRSGRANGHHGATGLACAPASKACELPAARMPEPISLRFARDQEKEAADRRFGECGRNQVSVTAAPTRTILASRALI